MLRVLEIRHTCVSNGFHSNCFYRLGFLAAPDALNSGLGVSVEQAASYFLNGHAIAPKYGICLLL